MMDQTKRFLVFVAAANDNTLVYLGPITKADEEFELL